MALIKFDPFRGFESMARRMSDMASDFERGFNFEFGNFSPRVDITEDESHIYMQAELPGLKKEDVKVTINDDHMLLIKGEKRREEKEENKDKSFIRVERNYGSFSRSFILPDNVNRDSIAARFENGVLDITLNKIEPEKPREVEVSIH